MGNSNYLVSAGRILLALYFLLPGIAKFAAPAQQIALMERHAIPAAMTMLLIAGAAQVIGAIMLLFNRHVRAVSLGFVLYVIVINVLMHNFWAFEGVEAAHETQNFFKNMGILAGLLVLAGVSVKRPLGFGDMFKSDRQFG